MDEHTLNGTKRFSYSNIKNIDLDSPYLYAVL